MNYKTKTKNMLKAHKLPVLQNILLVLCMQWGITIKFLTI